jgi:hypothetical protein
LPSEVVGDRVLRVSADVGLCDLFKNRPHIASLLQQVGGLDLEQLVELALLQAQRRIRVTVHEFDFCGVDLS